MKTLIIFYSRDGHTKIVAQEIAAEIGADIEELQVIKSNKGVLGYLKAGHDAMRKKQVEIQNPKSDPSSYDLVVIGTPVWAFTMCPAIRTWLTQYGKTLENTVFFVTMGGGGDKRTFTQMEELCGKAPLATATFIDKKIAKGEHKGRLAEFLGKLRESR